MAHCIKTPPPVSDSSARLEQGRWFAEQVHPHGAQLKSYLRAAFPSVPDPDDLVQESYLRIWKAQAVQPIRSARSFLFEVARRLAIDFTRHQRRSPTDALPDLTVLPVVDENADVAEAVSTREEVAFLLRVLHALPSRQREVMILRQIDGLSQKDIAARLGLSELTVQTHIVNGLRRIRTIFRQCSVCGRTSR